MSLCVCVGVGRDCVYLCVCSVAQSFPTLWNPMDCSPPGSCVHGIFQKKYWRRLPYLLQGVFLTQESSPHLLRLLHWQADFLPLSCLSCCCAQSRLTLCDPVDCSLPDSFVHEFSRQEYWSGFHFLLQGIFPTQGSNLHLFHRLRWQADTFSTAPPGKPYTSTFCSCRTEIK